MNLSYSLKLYGRSGIQIRYRKVTGDGDFVFGGSEKNYWKDVPQAVGLAVQSRLLLWLGEWYGDVSLGTPYLQTILGKHSKDTADTVIQDRILGTPGMLSIHTYVSEINPDSRLMTITDCTINTIYGTTQLEIASYVNY